MEVALALRFRPMELPLFPLKSQTPINFFPNHQLSIISHPQITPKFSAPSTKRLVITAQKRSTIEGVNEELNLIASQNLDFAPARRRVRNAFAEMQQQLDHCLFKVCF